MNASTAHHAQGEPRGQAKMQQRNVEASHAKAHLHGAQRAQRRRRACLDQITGRSDAMSTTAAINHTAHHGAKAAA